MSSFIEATHKLGPNIVFTGARKRAAVLRQTNAVTARVTGLTFEWPGKWLSPEQKASLNGHSPPSLIAVGHLRKNEIDIQYFLPEQNKNGQLVRYFGSRCTADDHASADRKIYHPRGSKKVGYLKKTLTIDLFLVYLF